MTSTPAVAAVLGFAVTVATIVSPSPASAQVAGAAKPSQITVTGTGTSELAPDMARVQLTVRTENKTARAALSQNNQSVSRVMEALTNDGIAPRDLRTSGFSINPKMSFYPKNSTSSDGPKTVGYTVQNTLTVIVRDLSKVGGILDRSVTLGVNRGGSLTFLNSNPDQAIEAARVKAMQNAMAKATTLADAAGVGLGRILSISEHSARPQPMAMMRGVAAQEADSVPVAAGENSYRVTVNAAWEIAQ